MGAGQSSVIASTEAERKAVGPFFLHTQEKSVLRALNNILAKVLTKNNLFDLASVLQDPVTCKDLFIVVSKSVEQEFQMLKFPEPKRRSDTTTLGFITKDRYDTPEIQGSYERTAACQEIARFLIRLVTLIAASTASVAVNRDISSLLLELKEPTKSVAVTPAIKGLNQLPATFVVKGTTPVPEDVLTFLTSGSLKQIQTTKCYAFDITPSIVIDAPRGIVYNSFGTQSSVITITMTMKNVPRDLALSPEDIEALRRRSVSSSYGSSGFGGQGLGGFGRPLSPYIGGKHKNRKTRRIIARRRRVTRRSVMQRGGADYPFVFVTLREVPYGVSDRCTGFECIKDEFYMDNAGNTYDKTEFENFQSKLRIEIPTPTTFGKRVLNNLTAITQLVDLLVYKETTPEEAVASAATGSESPFRPISDLGSRALKKLKAAQLSIDTIKTGASPAQYRAFLLASQIRVEGGVKKLSTQFCRDEWLDKTTTSNVAYSLLQSLFEDVAEGGMSSVAEDDCRKMVDAFLGANVVSPITTNSATLRDFEKIKFKSLAPTLVDGFCKGPGTATNEEDIAVLTTAHSQLRVLYTAHMEAIVKIVRSVIKIVTDPKDPQNVMLRLNEAFAKDPRGAVQVLEEIIRSARLQIATHFLEVEKVYVNTLSSINLSKQGIKVPAPPTPSNADLLPPVNTMFVSPSVVSGTDI